MNKNITVQINVDNKIEGINIPSSLFPLNSEPELFSYRNTVAAGKDILCVFDKVPYRYGRCYSNADSLAGELNAAEIPAKVYVGWVFSGFDGYPYHHAWVMSGNSLLDLSDDQRLMLWGDNGRKFIGKTGEELDEMILSFSLWAAKLKNSERCAVVGQPGDNMLYIGCPCSGEEGREIFRKLWNKYPDHPALIPGTGEDGLSPLQLKMKDLGLMDLTIKIP